MSSGRCLNPRAPDTYFLEALGCGGGGLQVTVHQGDGVGAFAYGGGDPFDRSVADVTGGEDPGQAGLQRQRGAAEGPAVAGAGQQVGSGEDEPPLVACDALAEPFRPRLGADEDEQGVGGGRCAVPRRRCRAVPAIRDRRCSRR